MSWEYNENLPPWDETMGPAPYVYSSKPPGHRCLWTAKWCMMNSQGRMEVKQFRPAPHTMSYEEKRAELLDIVFLQLPQAADAGRALIALDEGLHEYTVSMPFLNQARLLYPEYLVAWSDQVDAESIHNPLERPGWGILPELREKIKLAQAKRAEALFKRDDWTFPAVTK